MKSQELSLVSLKSRLPPALSLLYWPSVTIRDSNLQREWLILADSFQDSNSWPDRLSFGASPDVIGW